MSIVVRTLPLIGAVLWLGVGLVWRAWYQYRRFGHTGVVLFRSGDWATNLRGLGLILLFAFMLAQTVAYAFDTDALHGIALLPPATTGARLALGAALLFGGVVLMVTAQLDMGVSWRVGIDEKTRPGLVTHGVYRLSRNPIYVAILMAIAGFLVLLPTWPTLLALIGTWVGIRRQVIVEEAYLQRSYGSDFARYAAAVGRFVPGVGRLRDQHV